MERQLIVRVIEIHLVLPHMSFLMHLGSTLALAFVSLKDISKALPEDPCPGALASPPCQQAAQTCTCSRMHIRLWIISGQ